MSRNGSVALPNDAQGSIRRKVRVVAAGGAPGPRQATAPERRPAPGGGQALSAARATSPVTIATDTLASVPRR